MSQGAGRRVVEHALLRRAAERISCFPLIDVVFAGAFSGLPLAEVQLDPALHAGALARCIDRLPVDGVYINLCFSREQAAGAIPNEAGFQVVLDDGLEVRFGENDVASISRTHIDSLEDPRIARASLFHQGMLETFRSIPAEIHDRAAVFVGLTGAFSQLGFLVGLERLMMALVDEPGKVHLALRRRQEIAMRQAEELCRAGARFIWIGEGMASGSLISPAAYREFVLPYERELAGHIRRLGALSVLHICGNTTAMLEAIAETGADGCDVDSPTDWKAAVSVLGKSMCVKGNVNPLFFLPGNLHLLPAACVEALRVAAGLQGFILSTGCLVPRDSAVEGFEMMRQACAAPVPAG